MSGDIVNSLKSFFEEDFNTQREQWEKTLLKELKLPEVGNKNSKKMISGKDWPTLSLDHPSERLLASRPWKKAANTYTKIYPATFEAEIMDDLDSGVKCFFVEGEALTSELFNILERKISEFKDHQDISVIVLGKKEFKSSKIHIVSNLLTGDEAHDQGGDSIQELGLLTHKLIHHLENDKIHLGVYLDSNFFQNVAKIRALRLLTLKVLKEAKIKKDFEIIGLTSFQGWSLFERYSNMLRNETSVASGYIGGADTMQSTGYNALMELEAESALDEHRDRSLRMARNTAHVLGLESMLGVVADAAYGSYHLENLTTYFAEEAWKVMQSLERGEDLTPKIQEMREKRLENFKSRKSIMSGINDYPDKKEVLGVKLKTPKVFRPARSFEELRLKMEGMKKPEVYIATFGEYGALNARLNFVKNYFELLGLNVNDTGKSQTDKKEFLKDLSNRKEEIVVVCSLDTLYPEILNDLPEMKVRKYIAGKTEAKGYINLFAGQNVYEVLSNLVSAFSGGAQ